MDPPRLEETGLAILTAVYHHDRDTLGVLLGELTLGDAIETITFVSALLVGTLRSVEDFAAMQEGEMLPRLAARYVA